MARILRRRNRPLRAERKRSQQLVDGPWWDQPPYSVDTLMRYWPDAHSNGFGWGAGAAAVENRPGWALCGNGWLWDQDYNAWLERHLGGLAVEVPDHARLPYLAEP